MGGGAKKTETKIKQSMARERKKKTASKDGRPKGLDGAYVPWKTFALRASFRSRNRQRSIQTGAQGLVCREYDARLPPQSNKGHCHTHKVMMPLCELGARCLRA